eukprot:2955985-Rhodomonas_salina.1
MAFGAKSGDDGGKGEWSGAQVWKETVCKRCAQDAGTKGCVCFLSLSLSLVIPPSLPLPLSLFRSLARSLTNPPLSPCPLDCFNAPFSGIAVY